MFRSLSARNLSKPGVISVHLLASHSQALRVYEARQWRASSQSIVMTMSVCLSARLSQKPSDWTSPIFVHVAVVFLWRCCDPLCTSGLVDDVICSHNRFFGVSCVFLSGENVTTSASVSTFNQSLLNDKDQRRAHRYNIYNTRNAWQSLAYSPLNAIVSPPSEYLWKTLTYWSPECLTALFHSEHRK